MNYEEERHAERLLADGWLSNDQAHELRRKNSALRAALESIVNFHSAAHQTDATCMKQIARAAITKA